MSLVEADDSRESSRRDLLWPRKRHHFGTRIRDNASAQSAPRMLQGAAMSKLTHHNSSRNWPLGAACSLLLALSGCPSSDSKGPTAREQCEALAEDTCDKLVSCASKLTDEKLTDADHQDCVDSVTDETECKNAVSISDDYPDCVDAIRGATCDDVYSVDEDDNLVVNDLPPVCNGVIKVK